MTTVTPDTVNAHESEGTVLVRRALDAQTGITLPSAVLEQLAVYRDDLLHWNQRFNLTAITEPDAVDRRLIGDALRLLPVIDDLLPRLTAAGLPLRLIDVGTGAGLPGLVIKIARPELDVTLLDATAKKVSFLQYIIDTLNLDRVGAIHGRAEELGHDRRYRGGFGLSTARAVASLPALMELCLPLVSVGGWAVLPKGSDIDGELAEAERANRTLGGRIDSSNTLEYVHDAPVTRVVIVAKIHETPSRFPRRSGLPAKEPLGRIRT
jgi:16S rRNA (guanine527-N7)-methyltransferase